jgi:hypothetical protein
MDAYVDQFGLTELRLYSTAFMAWLALVFAWLLVTSSGAAASGSRSEARRPASSSSVRSTSSTRRVHGRTNLPAPTTAVVDVGHAASLSPDATPTLIAGYARSRRRAVPARPGSCTTLRSDPWRNWNHGRASARDAIAANEDALAAACEAD